jgi:hypothetical protein
MDPPLGHQFRNLLTLIVENWSKTRTLAFFFYIFVMVVHKNVLEYVIALVVVKNKVREKSA